MKRNQWIGETLNGRYRIEELLGQGGMSAVYKAVDPNLRRTVAIKIVHPHLSEDPSFIKRFEEEAAAIASLRHSNIVQVYDFNTDEGVNYMVMEYVGGETLQSRLKKLNNNQVKMPVDEAIRITLNVCSGLSYAHQRGMVHRDIKPANIMLDTHNQAILMDFGIVKIIGGTSNTLTGTVVGTANYMAPEIVRSETADQRSDVYSLGITLYEMLSGRPPFDADSAMTIMMKHLNDPVPDLDIIRDDLPVGLVTILLKALAKDRDNRYATAEALADDLRELSHMIPTKEIKKSVVQTQLDDQKELHTPTQVFQGIQTKDSDATVVDVIEKTEINADAPTTIVDKPVQPVNRKYEKKGSNKSILAALIGGLLIIAFVVIGFSTDWFGFAGEEPIVSEVSPTMDLVSIRQTEIEENTRLTASAPSQEIPLESENLALIEEQVEPAGEKYLTCQMTDSGSIESSPFFLMAFQGLDRVRNELNVGTEVLESTSNEYEMHLNQFQEMQCDLIISVGYMLGETTLAFAESHPDTKYSIIDFQVNNDLPNLNMQVYQIDQAAFLAGYLAASISETRKVATYGGMQIKPVEMFMDGFARGVQFFNETKGGNVEVIGWDVNRHTGMFVDSFDNVDIGVEIGNELINQNVDVIYPVAGSVGLGSAYVAMERGSVYIIGVDSDWAETYPETESVILTSTVKRIDNSIFNFVTDAMNGNFYQQYIGNLENGGVDLAPFHQFDDRISGEISSDLEEIRELIISGQIEFFPDYQY